MTEMYAVVRVDDGQEKVHGAIRAASDEPLLLPPLMVGLKMAGGGGESGFAAADGVAKRAAAAAGEDGVVGADVSEVDVDVVDVAVDVE